MPYNPLNLNSNKLWKILSILGIGILGLILILGVFLVILPKINIAPRTTQDLGTVSTNTNTPNQPNNRPKVVSNVVGPPFKENWNPATPTPSTGIAKDTRYKKKPPAFTPIVLDGKGTKLEFLDYIGGNKSVNNSGVARGLPEGGQTALIHPVLNSQNIYFSNNKNDPSLSPTISKTKEDKLVITINQTPPPIKHTSRVDKLFVPNESIKQKYVEVNVLVKAERINPLIESQTDSSKESPNEKPQLKIRTISKKGSNEWFKIPQEIPLGEWQRIGGKVLIRSNTEFIHMRAQCGENYRVSFVPEIKVSIPKKTKERKKQ